MCSTSRQRVLQLSCALRNGLQKFLKQLKARKQGEKVRRIEIKDKRRLPVDACDGNKWWLWHQIETWVIELDSECKEALHHQALDVGMWYGGLVMFWEDQELRDGTSNVVLRIILSKEEIVWGPG